MTNFLPTMALPADAKPACDGQWELFDSTDRADHRKAAALCAECPVRAGCKEIVTSQRDTATGRLAVEGTWAGQLYGDTKKRAMCGSPFGANEHYSRGEPVCDMCREARNAYRREMRAKNSLCGTNAGFARHKRWDEVPCDACREARAIYARERYEVKRARDKAREKAKREANNAA